MRLDILTVMVGVNFDVWLITQWVSDLVPVSDHNGWVIWSLSLITQWVSDLVPISDHTMGKWFGPNIWSHNGWVIWSQYLITQWVSDLVPISDHTMGEWFGPNIWSHNGWVIWSLYLTIQWGGQFEIAVLDHIMGEWFGPYLWSHNGWVIWSQNLTIQWVGSLKLLYWITQWVDGSRIFLHLTTHWFKAHCIQLQCSKSAWSSGCWQTLSGTNCTVLFRFWSSMHICQAKLKFSFSTDKLCKVIKMTFIIICFHHHLAIYELQNLAWPKNLKHCSPPMITILYLHVQFCVK